MDAWLPGWRQVVDIGAVAHNDGAILSLPALSGLTMDGIGLYVTQMLHPGIHTWKKFIGVCGNKDGPGINARWRISSTV